MAEIQAIADVRACYADCFVDARGTFVELPSLTVAPTATPRVGIAYNPRAGTLRGLHYTKAAPGPKLVFCATGEVFDVLVDMRPDSTTYRAWCSYKLLPGTGLLVPAGVAHGYLTRSDHCTLIYRFSTEHPDDAGVRWNDPAIGVEWPAAPVVISQNDRDRPLL